jgi:iron complex outermembrane receptor protein
VKKEELALTDVSSEVALLLNRPNGVSAVTLECIDSQMEVVVARKQDTTLRSCHRWWAALTGGSALWVMAFASSAGAQSAGSPVATDLSAEPSSSQSAPAELSEIIVTAQKRAERLMDVPSSIVAISADQLASQGITQVSDLQKVTPSLSVQESYFGTPIYTLRGVGFQSPALAAPPAVSVYLDQVPLPYPTETRGVSLDVERVEVLEGPQGTLFGENSTGGAINYIAAKPTQNFDAGLQLEGGNYATFQGSGFVSGPLADTVSARLALSTQQRGDYLISETRPNDTLGSQNLSSGRLIVDWNPSSQLKIELNLNGWIDKSDTQGIQFAELQLAVPTGYQGLVPALQAFRPAPFNDRVVDFLPNTSYRRNDSFYQGFIRADWNVTSDVLLTSLTAYSGFKQAAPTDGDGTDLPDFFIDDLGNIHSFTQELRFSGQTANDALKWMVGGNFEHHVSSENAVIHTNGTSAGEGPYLIAPNSIEEDNQIVQNTAGFAGVDYLVGRGVTISASGRFTQSDTGFSGCQRDTGDGGAAALIADITRVRVAPGACTTINVATFTPEGLIHERLDQNNVSWKVGLSWKADPDTLLYANVSRGYKAGSFSTLPYIFSNQVTPVTQESVVAYETGFKQQFPDLRLQITGAGFYYDYNNKQLLDTVTTILGPLPGLVTIPKSMIAGGEVSLLWKPVAGLTFTAGATYISSRVTRDDLVDDPTGAPVNIKGDPFPDTPKYQGNLDVEYDHALTADLAAYVGLSPQFRSKSNATFGGDSIYTISSYALLDARAGVSSNGGHWRIEIYGRNLTDDNYSTSVFHIVDAVTRTMGMPATYGARFTYNY